MSGVQRPRAALLLQEAARLHSKGDVQGALERCRAALVKEPESAPALNLLGVLALEGRDAQAGIASIRRATAIDPSNPEYLVNLGLALAQIGEIEEAEQAMERATRSPVAPSQAFLAYAQLLIRKGDSGRALEILWGAVQSKPEDQARWLQFTEAFTASSFTKIDDPAPLLGVLRMCFEREGIDYQRLVGPARQILWHHAPLADLRHLVETANTKAVREAVWDGRAVAALAEPAVLAVLKRAVLPDPSWERVLTAVRGELLAVTVTTDPPAHVIFEDPSVVCALARQCFLNGYAFFCREDRRRSGTRLPGLRGRPTGPGRLQDPFPGGRGRALLRIMAPVRDRKPSNVRSHVHVLATEPSVTLRLRADGTLPGPLADPAGPVRADYRRR